MPHCERCNQCFKTFKALKQHERDSPAHAVSYHSSFGDKHAFQQHQRGSPAHNQSYECRDCDRSFRSQSALEQHLENSTVHAQPVYVRNMNYTPLDLFFRSFHTFGYDPTGCPSDEMQRLHRHYGWGRDDPDGEDAWNRYQTALVREFNERYDKKKGCLDWYEASKNSVLAWQDLCTILKVRWPPTWVGGCHQVCF